MGLVDDGGSRERCGATFTRCFNDDFKPKIRSFSNSNFKKYVKLPQNEQGDVLTLDLPFKYLHRMRFN